MFSSIISRPNKIFLFPHRPRHSLVHRPIRCSSQFSGDLLNNYRPSSEIKIGICFSFQFNDNNQKNWKSGVKNQYSVGSNLRKFATMSDSDDKKAELKERLTPLQYHITQEKGTER